MLNKFGLSLWEDKRSVYTNPRLFREGSEEGEGREGRARGPDGPGRVWS